MSIAVTAPKKFELQDLACLEFLLRFRFSDVEQLLIEPTGGEDGSLILTGAGAPYYEIQVKGEEPALTAEKLGRWLAHFPEGRTDDTVLERLVREPHHHFVVVASARASDDAVRFVAPADWQGAPTSGITKTQILAVRTGFETYEPENVVTGTMYKDKIAHRDAAVKALTMAQMADALKRVTVIEQATRPAIISAIEAHLRRAGIPADRFDDVINRLKALVSAVRGKDSDASVAVAEQLLADAPTSLRPHDYVERGDEGAWIAALSHDNALLLSGISRSGKSQSARWVAATFEADGVDVRRFTDVDSAARFLREPTSAARLAVLDDPVGGAHAIPDPDRSLHGLTDLLGHLSPARRLIVAQGQERLLALIGGVTINGQDLDGHCWIDVGQTTPAFLKALWIRHADRTGVRDPLRSLMAAALGDGRLQLEPGSITYLAGRGAALDPNIDLPEAERLARIDALSLGRALKAEAKSPSLLPSLALGSSPLKAISMTELAFVQGQGGEALPSLSTFHGTSTGFGGGKRPVKAFPDYVAPPQLDGAAREDMSALEGRQILAIDGDRRINFAHPFYRAAAESALRQPTTFQADAILEHHRRALFCRSTATSRAAARNLDWLLDLLRSRTDGPKRVFQQAIDGLRSYFPATRDICFRFLARHAAESSALGLEKFWEMVGLISTIELSSLSWLDGEATLPVDGEVNQDAIFQAWVGPKREEVAASLALLDDPDVPGIAPRDATAALQYLRYHPAEMTLTQARRLLSFDEGVLRAGAVRAWLHVPREGDADVIDRIFADDHPAVARRALNAVMHSFDASPSARQQRLIDGLIGLTASPASAITMLELLVLFHREDRSVENPPWPLFEAVMPVVMRALPVGARFIDARLFDVMRTARKIISPVATAVICEAWIGWIEKSVAAQGWLSGFSLGVLDILVPATSGDPELRAGLVERVLALEPTDVRLTFISDAIDLWEDLTAAERQLLLDWIAAPGVDSRWRCAVALTRALVPAPVAAAALPTGISLGDGPAALRAGLPRPLFDACLSVQVSTPSRLGEWLPGGGEKSPWHAVAALVTRDPADPSFPAAFLDAIGTDDDAVRDELVTAVAELDPERVFALVLEESVYSGGPKLAGTFTVLLDSAVDEDMRSRWFDAIAEVAPEVISDPWRLKMWIERADDRREVERRLTGDYPVLLAVLTILENRADFEGELLDKWREMVGLMVEKAPPRMLGTVDFLIDALTKEGLMTDALQNQLKAERMRLVESHSAIRQRYRDAQADVTDWIFPDRIA